VNLAEVVDVGHAILAQDERHDERQDAETTAAPPRTTVNRGTAASSATRTASQRVAGSFTMKRQTVKHGAVRE
jgi:hypothetical protein